MVMEKIKKSNATKGGVSWDLPVKLAKEFGPVLSIPATRIFQNIACSGHWPKRWRMERGLSLKKVTEPLTEDELRIISLTPFLSKIFEQILLDWLLQYISDKIEWNQYGGLKETSINHYIEV